MERNELHSIHITVLLSLLGGSTKSDLKRRTKNIIEFS